MKPDPYWFFRKWGVQETVPMDDIYNRISELETMVKELQNENIGLTNALYELENSLDARIDILAERCKIQYDV